MRSARTAATLLAFALFVLMFAIYSSNHPAGFSANVVQTAANKGVLLALVAMAQTFVVITAGIDLSVGMVFVLTQLPCVVDRRGNAPGRRRSASSAFSLAGLACGAVNGLIVICRPPAADRRDDRDRRGLLRPRARPAADARRRRLRRRSPTR